MSLASRVLGFGLCVVGASIAGYYQALHSTGNIVNGVLLKYTVVDLPSSFYAAVTNQINNYLQQNVANEWTSGVAIGVVVAIGGLMLVARGDGKPAKPVSQVIPQSQPIAVKQRE